MPREDCRAPVLHCNRSKHMKNVHIRIAICLWNYISMDKQSFQLVTLSIMLPALLIFSVYLNTAHPAAFYLLDLEHLSMDLSQMLF